jgi:hypothetical protein
MHARKAAQNHIHEHGGGSYSDRKRQALFDALNALPCPGARAHPPPTKAGGSPPAPSRVPPPPTTTVPHVHEGVLIERYVADLDPVISAVAAPRSRQPELAGAAGLWPIHPERWSISLCWLDTLLSRGQIAHQSPFPGQVKKRLRPRNRTPHQPTRRAPPRLGGGWAFRSSCCSDSHRPSGTTVLPRLTAWPARRCGPTSIILGFIAPSAMPC